MNGAALALAGRYIEMARESIGPVTFALLRGQMKQGHRTYLDALTGTMAQAADSLGLDGEQGTTAAFRVVRVLLKSQVQDKWLPHAIVAARLLDQTIAHRNDIGEHLRVAKIAWERGGPDCPGQESTLARLWREFVVMANGRVGGMLTIATAMRQACMQ